MSLRWRAQAGFTLLEVVVAGGTLLAGVVCATTWFTLSASLLSSARQTGAAQAAAVQEVELLRSLPFAPAPAAAADAPPSLIVRVFPHAEPARNTASAWFSRTAANGRPPGTFFTRRQTAAGALLVAATFVTPLSAGWAPLQSELVEGYGAADPPPAAALLVEVVCEPQREAATPGRVETVIDAAADRPALITGWLP